MTVATGSGSKIYIATATTAVANQAAYEALTFVEVEDTESIGEFGDTTNPVTFIGLGDSRVQKKKGSQDAGTLTVSMAFNELLSGSPLTGQGRLLAASEDTTSTDYHFKVEYNDASTGSPLGTNTTRYFSGQVGTFVEGVPGADEILRVSSEIRINTAIIRVART